MSEKIDWIVFQRWAIDRISGHPDIFCEIFAVKCKKGICASKADCRACYLDFERCNGSAAEQREEKRLEASSINSNKKGIGWPGPRG